jgi:hypothetical protein
MADFIIDGLIRTVTEDRYKIELTRGQKGTYGWTITVHAKSLDDAFTDLQYVDEELRTRYASPAPEKKEE